MSIFEKMDASGFIEENIRRVFSIEIVDAKRMEGEFKQAIDRLKLELLNWQGTGRFTEAKLKTLLTYLEKSNEALRFRLERGMREGGSLLAKQATTDAVAEINVFEKKFMGVSGVIIPWDAISFSLSDKNYLFNNFKASIMAYDESVRAEMQRILTQSIVARRTYEEAKNDMVANLDGIKLQSWKIARICRTELHNIYNSSKLISFENIKKQYIKDLKKTVFIPMDNRTADDSKKLAKLRPVVNLDEAFTYKWKGKTRKFFAPPDRPNDRSILVPINPKWRK